MASGTENTDLAESSHLQSDEAQDFLSFVSLALDDFDTFDLGFSLLTAVLTPESFPRRPAAAEGRSVRVVISQYDSLLRARRLHDEQLRTLSQPSESSRSKAVALKIPNPKGDLDNAQNRELWTAMAKELRLLKNHFISEHANIVDLLGVSWTTLDNEPSALFPLLVLEAAELGDMTAFCQDGRRLEPRKWFALAVDVTAGLTALHNAGVFHGDLKPENVLIFEDAELTYKAKLADFGSSVFIDDLDGPLRVTSRTPFWAAPETVEPLTAEQLLKADLFSLGMLLWDMLPGGYLKKTDAAIRSRELPFRRNIEEMRAAGDELGETAAYLLKGYWDGLHPSSDDDRIEESESEELTLGDRVGFAIMALLKAPSERLAPADEVYREMRNVFHFVVKKDFLYAIRNIGRRSLPTWNSQEINVLHHPPCRQSLSPLRLVVLTPFWKSLQKKIPMCLGRMLLALRFTESCMVSLLWTYRGFKSTKMRQGVPPLQTGKEYST
jgi:serine/threonine protein kinase